MELEKIKILDATFDTKILPDFVFTTFQITSMQKISLETNLKHRRSMFSSTKKHCVHLKAFQHLLPNRSGLQSCTSFCGKYAGPRN